jgi:hypothetical protein
MAIIMSASGRVVGDPTAAAPGLAPRLLTAINVTALLADLDPLFYIFKVGHVVAGSPVTEADLLGSAGNVALVEGDTVQSNAADGVNFRASFTSTWSYSAIGGASGNHVWVGLYDSSAGSPQPLLALRDLGALP